MSGLSEGGGRAVLRMLPLLLLMSRTELSVPESNYSSASSSWRRRGLKRVPRIDLDNLIQSAFLSTCAITLLHQVYLIFPFQQTKEVGVKNRNSL